MELASKKRTRTLLQTQKLKEQTKKRLKKEGGYGRTSSASDPDSDSDFEVPRQLEKGEEAWVPARQLKNLKEGKVEREVVPVVVEEAEPVSLLDQKLATLKNTPTPIDRDSKIRAQVEKMIEEEESITRALTQDTKLQSVADLAKGVEYKKSLRTTWRPPGWAEKYTEREVNKMRNDEGILVQGEGIPPPLFSFEAMKIPAAILKVLRKKGIKKPTPIQTQGLPCVLSGRDMIGIANTGSGKTMVFVLPALLFALEEELKIPVVSGEGPFSLILVPSRELADQIYNILLDFVEALVKAGHPRLNVLLVMGGTQTERAHQGVHVVVATPGRLIDMLNKDKLSLAFCKLFCLDEADRMLDGIFAEDIRKVMDHFHGQRQTVLFSATMPESIRNFGEKALVHPCLVNVGRAGAASLDVLQEVEFVPMDLKLMYLANCLLKTPPPVIIFCENKRDVDVIHEYLLRRSVHATSIHGSKDQEERRQAIDDFRNGSKDVLIATDVASKGLDFPNILHVINFDMPKDIETYVHRIGRTGRSRRTGTATTFVDKECSETLLLDLKELLIESRQPIPPFMKHLKPANAVLLPLLEEMSGFKGCRFCGGLGHRIVHCPKAEEKRLKASKAQSSGGGPDFMR